MINILIYGKNIYSCKKIIKAISNLYMSVRICQIATSFSEIIEATNSMNIDLIIFDFINKDVHYIKDHQEKLFLKNNIPVIIFTKDLISYNFNFPSNITLVNNYTSLYDELVYCSSHYRSNDNLKLLISKELDSLCFDQNHVGTQYLIEVVYAVYNNYEYLHNLSKYVYPNIARKYSISPNTLKCNIFQATLHSYVSCEESKLESYLERSCIEKPSTKTYIFSIINHIKLGTPKKWCS